MHKIQVNKISTTVDIAIITTSYSVTVTPPSETCLSCLKQIRHEKHHN